MNRTKPNKNEVADILDSLYLDFLSKYERALKDYAGRLEIKKRISEGEQPTNKNFAKHVEYSEGRLDTFRECLACIRALKLRGDKESENL